MLATIESEWGARGGPVAGLETSVWKRISFLNARHCTRELWIAPAKRPFQSISRYNESKPLVKSLKRLTSRSRSIPYSQEIDVACLIIQAPFISCIS